VSDIKTLAKEVKNQITLASHHAQDQERKVQEKERTAASKQRSMLRKFIPKAGKNLENIQKQQLQQALHQKRELKSVYQMKILTCIQARRDNGCSTFYLLTSIVFRLERHAKSDNATLRNGSSRLPSSSDGTTDPDRHSFGAREKVRGTRQY
jgi:ribosomal protein S20